jgi:hypothetical protein
MYLQQLLDFPHPEEDKSSLHPSPFVFKIHFNITFTSAPKYYQWSFSITYCAVKHVFVFLIIYYDIKRLNVFLLRKINLCYRNYA